jgi:ribosomal protein S12 methylthiotransferase accessory factor
VFVPAGLACYGPQYTGDGSPYEVNSSNGLASGNCFEEAICHALCELVERDAWTLADLRSRWIPLAWREAVFGAVVASRGWDDADVYPRIDLRDAGAPIAELMEKFHLAGLHPVVRDMRSDFGISSVIAGIADDGVPGFPQAHTGMGAHPNARIAVIRALTELAQSRAVDIQGMREDISPAGALVHAADRHLQRVQKIQPGCWMLQQGGMERPFGEIASIENEDIADDIRLIFSRLLQNGIERVIVVDFSEPGPFSVVRVLVPGLEFWALDQGKLGQRAVRFWRQHV